MWQEILPIRVLTQEEALGLRLMNDPTDAHPPGMRHHHNFWANDTFLISANQADSVAVHMDGEVVNSVSVENGLQKGL